VIRTEGSHPQRYVGWHRAQRRAVVVKDSSLDK
jgi:hypothetical protein